MIGGCIKDRRECLIASIEQIGDHQIGRLDYAYAMPITRWTASETVAADEPSDWTCIKTTIFLQRKTVPLADVHVSVLDSRLGGAKLAYIRHLRLVRSRLRTPTRPRERRHVHFPKRWTHEPHSHHWCRQLGPIQRSGDRASVVQRMLDLMRQARQQLDPGRLTRSRRFLHCHIRRLQWLSIWSCAAVG
jgi:hypothetical protein